MSELVSAKPYSTGLKWLLRLLSGKPHHIIGPMYDPYMLRWYLIPRNKRFNIYLHKFMRDDDDRALHDHPWWFISFLLKGSYTEITDIGIIRRRLLSLAYRPATWRHRVVLNSPSAYTIVVTGPVSRLWCFWCDSGKRFVNWKEFTSPSNTGEIGRGCD